MTSSLTAVAGQPVVRIVPRKTRVGLVAGGLGAYWPQFPALLPQLQASARRVSERLARLDCEVVDVGFISDAQQGAAAAERLRLADCDLIVGFLTTYMTATMLVPVAQRTGAPMLLLNLQPFLCVFASWLWLGEKPGRQFYPWAVVAVLCGMVLAWSPDALNDPHVFALGLVFVGGTIFSWGISTTAGRGAMLEIDFKTAVTLRYAIGAVSTLGCAAVLGYLHLVDDAS